MQSKLLPYLLICLAGFSCKKNENQKAVVDLHFQAKVAGSDYVLADDFINGDGLHLRIEAVWFYIADVRFVNKKGKEVLAEEIALVKLDANGFATASVKIPAGDYTALRFGIGVPQALNEADPAEFNESGHPLNVTENTYWGMNGMYRFVMIDGRYDVEGDGTPDGTFSYHTGYNESYREVEFAGDFSFDRKGSYSHEIIIDIEKLFYVSGSEVDVLTESYYDGDLSNIDLAHRISDNFMNSLSLHH